MEVVEVAEPEQGPTLDLKWVALACGSEELPLRH